METLQTVKYGVYNYDSKNKKCYIKFDTRDEAEKECDKINFRWQTCSFCVCEIEE